MKVFDYEQFLNAVVSSFKIGVLILVGINAVLRNFVSRKVAPHKCCPQDPEISQPPPPDDPTPQKFRIS
ncbi:MAG: hypothetical protein QXL15_05045 [Candidatus Korarchaeota archaeon]